MTAVTTALVFLPLALFGNVAGLEIVQPMAIVVLGGLVTTTLFTLAGVPAIYMLFGGKPEPELELPVGVAAAGKMDEAFSSVSKTETVTKAVD